MPRIAWIVLLFLLALLPRAAHARSPAPSWVSAELPTTPSTSHQYALVPLAAPSKERPLGTVAILGADASPRPLAGNLDDENEHIVWAYAWDLASKRVIAKRRVGRMAPSLPAVVAVRAGDRILVAAGSNFDEPSEVVLFTLDEALDVVTREVLGQGRRPSLAASGEWIVAGFFEHRDTDVLPPWAEEPPLHDAFHAVVLDRSTHVVMGARVFQGRRLLAPDLDPRLSMRAIALRDGRAYISLPGWAEATIVSARLPSLVPVKTRLLDGFQMPSGSAPIYAVGRDLVVVTPQGWRILSPELDVVGRVGAVGYTMAWHARSATLLESSTQAKWFPWSVMHVDQCSQLVWAGDRAVAMCDGDEDTGEPMRIFYRSRTAP